MSELIVVCKYTTGCALNKTTCPDWKAPTATSETRN
jgi:hypothetical protein